MNWMDLISAAGVLILACVILAALNTHRRPSRSSYLMHEGASSGVSGLLAKAAMGLIAVGVLIGFLVVWVIVAQLLNGVLVHYIGQSEYIAPLAWMLSAAVSAALTLIVLISATRVASSIRR